MPVLADTDLWWLAVKTLAAGTLLAVLGGLLLRGIMAESAAPDGAAASHRPEEGTSTGGDASRAALGTLESWLVQFALSLSIGAWLAVLLAEFGRFSAGWVAGLIAGACVALRAAVGPASRKVRSGSTGTRTRQAVALGALCLLASVLYLPPFQTVLWGSDSTAYLNFGRQISETGAFVFEDGFLADIPLETRRALFLNTTPSDVTGTYTRFPGGFLIPDITRDRVTAGFSPLFPALVALFHQLFGLEGALFIGPVFALLSVCAVFFIGARLKGTLTGLLAATLLAVSAPQAWFARFPLPAVVSQFFVLAGLLALLVSVEQDRRRLAVGAGWLLGVAMLGKFDLVAVLPVSAMSILAVAVLASGTVRLPVAWYALLGFGLPLVHVATHFLVLPSHYGPFVAWVISTSGLGSAAAVPALTGTLVAVLLLALATKGRGWPTRFWGPRQRSRLWAMLVLALLAVYAIGYVKSSQNRLGETITWLGWYLSWPVLALAGVGALSGFRMWWRGRPDAGLLIVVGLLAVASGHYVYDPHERSELIWSIRRFVPTVIPGILLVVSVAATDLLGIVGRRYHTVATILACGSLVFLVGRPAAATFGERPWDGAIEASRRIAARFPPGSVVLVGPELSGIHLQTTLAYLYDVDALVIQPHIARDASPLEGQVLAWLQSGRPVFAIIGADDPLFFAPRLLCAEHAGIDVDLTALETTTARRPTAMVKRTARLRVVQLTEKGGSHVTSLDVGAPAEDGMFMLAGFHDAERARDPRVGSYRWTGHVASIQVPWVEEYQFVVDGGRPAGAPLAEMSVWIDGQLAADRVALPNTPTPIAVRNPVSKGARAVQVTIQSTVFNPTALGLSTDGRDLGVRVYRVDFPEQPAPPLAAGPAARRPLIR